MRIPIPLPNGGTEGAEDFSPWRSDYLSDPVPSRAGDGTLRLLLQPL